MSGSPPAPTPPAAASLDEGRRAAAVTSLRWTGAMLAILVVWLIISVVVRPVAFLAPVIALTAVLFTFAAWRAAARGTSSGHPVSVWAVVGVVLDVVVSVGIVVIVGWSLLLLVALARS